MKRFEQLSSELKLADATNGRTAAGDAPRSKRSRVACIALASLVCLAAGPPNHQRGRHNGIFQRSQPEPAPQAAAPAVPEPRLPAPGAPRYPTSGVRPMFRNVSLQPTGAPPQAGVQMAPGSQLPPGAQLAPGQSLPPELMAQMQPAGGCQSCQNGGGGLSPAAPHCIHGIDCVEGGACAELGWGAVGPIPWQAFAQGEYVGHERLAHVPVYRLRVDDMLEFVYRVTRDEQSTPYQINVGDELKLESLTDAQLNRELVVVQPDGSITLRLLGQVVATGRTFPQLQKEVEEAYRKFYKDPSITVTPLKINTKLEDLRVTINGKAGFGPQIYNARVTPEGTVQLPVVGSIPAQGLSIPEFKRELDERYAIEIEGIEVMPVLKERAARYVFVVGEVRTPGRFALTGPTTAMQAISMAGGWQVGANLRQVVVFRRGDDWRLMATMLDLRGALYAKQPCPSD
jgi:polysaccharide export outer membrane protein